MLTEKDAKAITDPITRQDIEDTIKILKNSKSLGVDDYHGEFYEHFEVEVTPLLQ